MDTRGEIVGEISTVLERLGAHPTLLAIIGSWGDTLEDAEVLELLKDWNEGRFQWESIARAGKRPKFRVVR